MAIIPRSVPALPPRSMAIRRCGDDLFSPQNQAFSNTIGGHGVGRGEPDLGRPELRRGDPWGGYHREQGRGEPHRDRLCRQGSNRQLRSSRTRISCPEPFERGCLGTRLSSGPGIDTGPDDVNISPGCSVGSRPPRTGVMATGRSRREGLITWISRRSGSPFRRARPASSQRPGIPGSSYRATSHSRRARSGEEWGGSQGIRGSARP